MNLEIRLFGDAVLRKRCKEVETFDDELKKVVNDILDTLRHHDNAIGLSAPQVGYDLRIFITSSFDMDDQGEWKVEPYTVYINPKILSFSDEQVWMPEGCMSIPNVYSDVLRPEKIHIEAQDIDGNIFEKELEGWPARIFMHENDHLNGVLFIDRISKKERNRMERELNKIKKRQKKQLQP